MDPAGGLERSRAPRFGLRFDRGRAQLVLGEAYGAGPLRLETLVCDLGGLRGRVSLTEGWRAFRHRRSTLIEARVSIALADLARTIGETLSAEVTLIGAPGGMSLAARTSAQVVATDLVWGWDAADLLVVASNARALPRGPRGPLASAHDLLAALTLELDASRGAMRLVDPLRRALLETMLPIGLRVPEARGMVRSAIVDGGRIVLSASLDGSAIEPARETLEAARALAAATTALIDGDLSSARRVASELLRSSSTPVRTRALAHVVEAGDATPSDATVAGLAAELTRALEQRPAVPANVAASALAYARAEPHGGAAAEALTLAATTIAGADRALAAELARAALGRLPLDRSPSALDVALLARAITLASAGGVLAGATSALTTGSWEPIVRALAERATSDRESIAVLRAHALALEHAGRLAEALAAFRVVLRREDDEASATGAARVLEALERWDEALSAWDRVATLRVALGNEAEARDARLRAAVAAERTGLVDAAIARLTDAVDDVAVDVGALDAAAALAAKLASLGRSEEAAALDRRLPRLVDALGPAFAMEGQAALTAAAERAIARRDGACARACIEALERLVPESPRVAALTRSLRTVSEASLTDGDASTLRARAEQLRAEGHGGDAARVLIELFARTADAAVLRAAIELADRAGDANARASVFDRALQLLPNGAARDAIAKRRG